MLHLEFNVVAALRVSDVKGLFVWATSVPFPINGTNVVKTPNTQSTVGTLIPRNIELSTAPLKVCMATDQIEF